MRILTRTYRIPTGRQRDMAATIQYCCGFVFLCMKVFMCSGQGCVLNGALCIKVQCDRVSSAKQWIRWQNQRVYGCVFIRFLRSVLYFRKRSSTLIAGNFNLAHVTATWFNLLPPPPTHTHTHTTPGFGSPRVVKLNVMTPRALESCTSYRIQFTSVELGAALMNVCAEVLGWPHGTEVFLKS
jgi:hypothetical protein